MASFVLGMFLPISSKCSIRLHCFAEYWDILSLCLLELSIEVFGSEVLPLFHKYKCDVMFPVANLFERLESRNLLNKASSDCLKV